MTGRSSRRRPGVVPLLLTAAIYGDLAWLVDHFDGSAWLVTLLATLTGVTAGAALVGAVEHLDRARERRRPMNRPDP